MIDIYAQTYMLATRLETQTIVDAPKPGGKRPGLRRFFLKGRNKKWDVPANWLD